MDVETLLKKGYTTVPSTDFLPDFRDPAINSIDSGVIWMNRSHDPQKKTAGYFPLTPGCLIGILIILAYDHP